MILQDRLRLPSPFDPSASRYKDWLHLNILHHETGSVGLINVSLHGSPLDPGSRAVGAALVHVPGVGWIGNVEIRALTEASIGRASIGLERVALSVHHSSRTLAASVRDEENSLAIRLTGRSVAAPVVVEEPLPLGSGWISWYAMPRLTLEGEWVIDGARTDLRNASAYHDHNWGRWHWGDDLGWEWGCFLAPSPGAAFVLSRTTDRAHRHLGVPSLVVRAEQGRRTFSGAAVELEYDGVLEATMRRLPGAIAALHQDRARVRLPKSLRISADDGIDHVVLEFTAHAAAQLALADPLVRGYAFIHEMAGEFTYSGVVCKKEISGAGLGVLEHVY
jgi:hypothetical protein